MFGCVCERKEPQRRVHKIEETLTETELETEK